jgi:hypothetical protein
MLDIRIYEGIKTSKQTIRLEEIQLCLTHAWFENLKLNVGLQWTVLLNLKVWLWLPFTLTKSNASCSTMRIYGGYSYKIL